MNNLKDNLIELLEDTSFAPYTFEDLQKLTKATYIDLQDALDELKKEYIIHETKKHRFGLLKTFNMYKGIIDVKEKGFGFIKSENFENEFFVPRCNVNHALDNDTVIFRITDTTTDEKDEAEVVKVIKRSLKYCVGVISNRYFTKELVPIDSKLNIFFKITDFQNAVVDDVVKVEIDEFIDETEVTCHVIEILGNINDIGMDIKAVASKYDFYQEFDNEALECLNEVVKNYNEIDKEKEFNRREFIDKNIITIDSEEAKDLDDAVSVERLENGNFLLGVYIADVSFFVKEDSPLDKACFDRGTSCYLVDRVIPMLPHKLSNDLCSLNENEKKLVTACMMEIDKTGTVVNYEIKEAVIKTKHRMTYTNVNKIINGDQEVQEEYYDIVSDIFTMNKLAKILNNMRVERGSLNFEVPEVEIIVDSTGKPIDVKLRERFDGEKLIEEFMLIANETVACCIRDLDLPFIYRIHDVPNQDKLKRFNKILKNTNFSLNLKKNQKITPKVLQTLLDEVNEKDSAISTMLLRLMAKAKYDVYNIGHYGLASKCYTHFTSPIRRYPDLIVHRLLKKYLFRGEVSVEEQNKTFNKLTLIAEQSSKRERDAIECEYEVNDMKMAEFMRDHIGEEYEGTISSVTNFGMFVTLPNGIEGLIRLGSIKDDYYEYQDNLMALYGRHTKKSYRLGDKVRIRVVGANKQNREIDFNLSLKTNRNMVKYSSQRKERSNHEKRRTYSRRKK